MPNAVAFSRVSAKIHCRFILILGRLDNAICLEQEHNFHLPVQFQEIVSEAQETEIESELLLNTYLIALCIFYILFCTRLFTYFMKLRIALLVNCPLSPASVLKCPLLHFSIHCYLRITKLPLFKNLRIKSGKEFITEVNPCPPIESKTHQLFDVVCKCV